MTAHDSGIYDGYSVAQGPSDSLDPQMVSDRQSTMHTVLPLLDHQNLKKIHLQLKHGTVSTVRDYARPAGMWHADMEGVVKAIITDCGFHLCDLPAPHPKVATRTPTDHPKGLVSIDVIKLESQNFLHPVDECTSWSEAAAIPSKSMDCHSRTFYEMHVHRRGTPFNIRCDNEYNNGPFLDFCRTMYIALVPVAANDHEPTARSKTQTGPCGVVSTALGPVTNDHRALLLRPKPCLVRISCSGRREHRHSNYYTTVGRPYTLNWMPTYLPRPQCKNTSNSWHVDDY